MRVLDSHLHLWDPELLEYDWLEGPLAFRFADTELEHARLEHATTEKSVFVQAETVEDRFLDEVRWVTTMAEPLGIVGIVAGARLDRGSDTVAHLDGLAAEPLVVGVRHNLQGEPDGLAVSAAFVTGARDVAQRGWSFDACVRADQLPEIARLAGAIPELRMVLDHLGKPAVGTAAEPLAPTSEWVRDLDELARHPEVFCKLSGLPGEAAGDWDAGQLVPFLDAAADAFGPERLMWGSDWPVSVIGPAEEGDPHAPADGSPTYQYTARSRWADAVAAWAADRGHGVDAIMWANAESFYRTDARPTVFTDPAPRRRGILGWLRG
ncbi:amidohydrolase family protein [Microbacterium saperdae]|uniref:L-fuconolactonase n=1 Tax=Microbacterium saperdae TaxID=69368 RepID=A0A543BI34_9MICO|nr:amidohydrolase family protein [Microbacterium saperdae]TQL84510.1 L-fuconolactonase [Microbacterium saperdae]GGM60964.1 metal-dependent hydrolase [Microbacterium saperdae]